MFGIFVHYSTRPIYDVSMNLFCRPPSVDIFNILPGFLWQPLLNSLYWYKDIVRCTHLVSRILQHGCKCSSWLKVNKISNQTVHHQSATKLDSMMNYSLENRIWRQTSGWVTCAKPSRQYTDPAVSYTFSRRFLNQNYPKYISDVVSKILEGKNKNNYQMFYLNLWSSRNWVSCGESWKSLLPIFLMFHGTDFGGFLVCCFKAIQQLNGVEKNFCCN